MLCKRAWTEIRMRCVLAARPSSIHLAQKMRSGATHFLMKTLPKVATGWRYSARHNLTRVMSIFGIKPLLAELRA